MIGLQPFRYCCILTLSTASIVVPRPARAADTLRNDAGNHRRDVTVTELRATNKHYTNSQERYFTTNIGVIFIRTWMLCWKQNCYNYAFSWQNNKRRVSGVTSSTT